MKVLARECVNYDPCQRPKILQEDEQRCGRPECPDVSLSLEFLLLHIETALGQLFRGRHIGISCHLCH